jgi:uncharacterized protein
MDTFKQRKKILFAFLILAVLSMAALPRLNFIFDFERFFPKGDPDLDFFYEFKAEFEDDDNFLLVAFTHPVSIFNVDLLKKIDSFCIAANQLENVVQVQSVTNFKYFIKMPLGGFSPPYPALHLNEPHRIQSDSVKIMSDERLAGNLVSEDAKSAVVAIKTINGLNQKDADKIILGLNELLANFNENEYHILGRANFQSVLVRQQIFEFVFSTIVSALLVTIVFFFIFRRALGVMIALISMLMCLLLFMGAIGWLQIELDALSTLFPIIMIIVGVSDVVHLTSKYIDEYEKTQSSKTAIHTTFREIGLATFLTSFTTAIGFATLFTSRIPPVKNFGITAAMGVMIAYVTTILFTTAFLSFFPAEKVSVINQQRNSWKKGMTQLYVWGKNSPRIITAWMIFFIAFCSYGIYLISTDVKIYETLPKGIKVTEDFRYFEETFAGFRPYEIAAIAADGYTLSDYEVLSEINKVEEYVKSFDQVNGVVSVTALHKTLNRAMNGDRAAFYRFPDNEEAFNRMKPLLSRVPASQTAVLVNQDNTKGRISGKVKDIGSEKIDSITQAVEAFIASETNRSVVDFKITGTGVIFDKNNQYLRESLLYGLSIAFIMVSIVMAVLFKNWKMVVISLIPNVFPLMFGGAMMGYSGIALDAPTAIIFAISFGIAVDDTIHFLSKMKIELSKGLQLEQAIENAFVQTGKAIIITTIILFFGFLILLFSKTPGVQSVGLLVSGTLFTAVIADLALIPLLSRWLLGSENK